MLKRNPSKLILFFIIALLVPVGVPASSAPARTVFPPRPFQAQGMLQITLKPTDRLRGNPVVLNALLRAANRWESIIQTPIHIVIDVDFGPTNFGAEFPGNVAARTDEQKITMFSNYDQIRAALIAKATGENELALVSSLPTAGLKTDVVPPAGITATNANLRALGLLDAVADPEGAHPKIGFNSNAPFDFDPNNTIDSEGLDFDAVATHEIGHVLGFVSNVFYTEDGSFPNFMFISVLDLFRFAPGVTLGTFPTARRKLKSGDEHVFFDGGNEIPFATGNFEGKGGDGFQGSHWKDRPSGGAIGIMDPHLDLGERSVITDADRRALDVIGYTFKAAGGPVSSLGPITGSLAGDVVTLSGSITDAGTAITMAQTTLLDESENIVRQDAPFPFNSEKQDNASLEAQDTTGFSLEVKGLADLPTAFKCRLVLMDSLGRQTEARTADFSQGSPDGPDIKSASFNGSNITVKGTGLRGQADLEINGVIVGSKNNDSKKKLKIKGKRDTLNLKTGANRVRVRENNLWSNIKLLTNATD